MVYLHAKYEMPILNDKKVTARTRFVTSARTSLTSRSKLKVKCHQQWYATHHLDVVYLHPKYEKPVLKDKNVTARTRFAMDARTSLTLRSKVTNNGTRHIVCRWSTYMPNMQSLSWTTTKLQPGHDLLRTDARTDRLITIGRLPLCDGALIKYTTSYLDLHSEFTMRAD